MDGAKELAKLMKDTDTIIDEFSPKDPFPKRIFAAHSESDKTADIAGIEKLQNISVEIMQKSSKVYLWKRPGRPCHVRDRGLRLRWSRALKYIILLASALACVKVIK